MRFDVRTELVGRLVSGWLVQKLINNGKSAAVFMAEKAGVRAALKIFDPAIVQRYGRAAQLERINRERSLIGKEHTEALDPDVSTQNVRSGRAPDPGAAIAERGRPALSDHGARERALGPGLIRPARRFACIFESVLCREPDFRVDLRDGRDAAGSNT